MFPRILHLNSQKMNLRAGEISYLRVAAFHIRISLSRTAGIPTSHYVMSTRVESKSPISCSQLPHLTLPAHKRSCSDICCSSAIKHCCHSPGLFGPRGGEKANMACAASSSTASIRQSAPGLLFRITQNEPLFGYHIISALRTLSVMC